jgi:hypothetical protein
MAEVTYETTEATLRLAFGLMTNGIPDKRWEDVAVQLTTDSLAILRYRLERVERSDLRFLQLCQLAALLATNNPRVQAMLEDTRLDASARRRLTDIGWLTRDLGGNPFDDIDVRRAVLHELDVACVQRVELPPELAPVRCDDRAAAILRAWACEFGPHNHTDEASAVYTQICVRATMSYRQQLDRLWDNQNLPEEDALAPEKQKNTYTLDMWSHGNPVLPLLAVLTLLRKSGVPMHVRLGRHARWAQPPAIALVPSACEPPAAWQVGLLLPPNVRVGGLPIGVACELVRRTGSTAPPGSELQQLACALGE